MVDRNYWLTCTNQRCRPRLCPGRTFDAKRQQKCRSSMFTFEEPHTRTHSPISVGHNVVLLPYHMDDLIVICGKEGLCKNSNDCFDEQESFKPYCGNQVLIVSVQGKVVGERIMHGDLIELKHHYQPTNNTDQTHTWIGCDPLDTRKCKRYSCPNQADCNHEAFKLYIL